MGVELEPMDEYTEALTEFFEKNNLRMTEVTVGNHSMSIYRFR